MEVEFQVGECTALYCDGRELDSDDDEIFTSSLTLDPGWVTIYARVEGSTFIKAVIEDDIRAEWCLRRKTPLTRFADLAGMTKTDCWPRTSVVRTPVRWVSCPPVRTFCCDVPPAICSSS